jgi:hypothetical protein
MENRLFAYAGEVPELVLNGRMARACPVCPVWAAVQAGHFTPPDRSYPQEEHFGFLDKRLIFNV